MARGKVVFCHSWFTLGARAVKDAAVFVNDVFLSNRPEIRAVTLKKLNSVVTGQVRANGDNLSSGRERSR